MRLGKVIGQLVATTRVSGIPPAALLLIEPLEWARPPVCRARIATDFLGAGQGDIVLVASGSAARRALPDAGAVDLVIIGIVDGLVTRGGQG